tara:strand:- start:93 stop:287 length:195 start_codon:yes stop_codon:yes gene_type:complete
VSRTTRLTVRALEFILPKIPLTERHLVQRAIPRMAGKRGLAVLDVCGGILGSVGFEVCSALSDA